MGDTMNQIMVRTIVKKAIRDIRTDPERTTRNLIDMALNFADSRFQKKFYSSAQSLLANENSGYYALVKETLTKVNGDSLLTFGMNVGYNGLYKGSQTIRKVESEAGYNVPWTISMTVTEGKVFDPHHRAIEQGEKLGIHTWQLFSDHGIFECMAIAEHHPESAFVIFCDSGEVDWSVLDYAEDIRNIAIMVPFDKDAAVVCDMLRVSGILYGLYDTYTEEDLEAVESGRLLHDMEQLHPAFCILKPQFPCQKELQNRVYSWITKARMEQAYRTIPWELYGDMLLVDEVISDDPYWVGFDTYGQLHTQDGIDRTYGHNIFVNDLPEVLKRAFPKQKGTT